MAAMDAKSEAFFKAIDEASEEQKSEIIADIDEYKKRRLEEAKEEAKVKYTEYINAAAQKLSSEDGVETAKRTNDMKKNVMTTREDITNRVFADVKKRIVEFTESDEYEKLLCDSAKKMLNVCKDAPFEIFMREKDLKYSDAIKNISGQITISTDDSIELGGIYCVCTEKNIKLNDLLETRLASQMEWFYENSGLTL